MHLSTHRLPHGELMRLAKLVGVSPRTLRNWRDREGQSGSPGRPRHGQEARQSARKRTEGVWCELPRGHDGWRTALAALSRAGVQVPTRLVQEAVRLLKDERARRERERIEENRVHVEVHARDVLWPLDQTFLMRDEQGELRSLCVRDAGSPRVLGLSIGPPATGKDVVRLLEATAKARGGPPLAVQFDNGSENKNADVDIWLREHRVIVIWNEPRTPQHNPRAEHSIGDLKLAGGLDRAARRGAGVVQGPVGSREPGGLETRRATCARLLDAWARLDATPRPSLGGLTPAELDKIMPRADDLADRARLYTEVCEDRRRIALAPLDARAQRKAAREAGWSALQRYGLVTRTRGGCLVPTRKAEGIS